ncbi:MAG: signal peptidase I [Bacteroidetes bacterium]|nr:signal peptidase I [Bacteroidota bacterium]
MRTRVFEILKKTWWPTLKGLSYFVFIALLALAIRIFLIEFYKIPSSSMEPTLVPGDFIIVSKMSYGARILKIKKFLKKNRIEYIRTWGWGSIKKGDVFVFNWPSYYTLNDSFPNIYGDYIIKRCYGLPGDTVTIKNEGMKNYYIAEGRSDLFPHDSTLKWTLDCYGPLLVPGKGIRLELTPITAKHYKDVLLYEGYKTEIRGDSVFINGQYASTFIFKNNYYFMKGDNFYGSLDSRYWGFVPEGNIVGKAKLIAFSLNPSIPGIKKIVWKRFVNLIK